MRSLSINTSNKFLRITKRYLSTLTILAFLIVQISWATAVVMANKGTDFYLYYLAARAFKQGQDVYNLDAADWQHLAAKAGVPHYAPPYRYPPLAAVLVSPLIILPPRHAFAIWGVLNALALLATALLLSQVVAGRWVDPLIFVGLAGYVPALTTVYAGQVNLFVLLAVAVYIYAFIRGHAIGAGLALATGVMLKPIPATLGVHALWRRQPRIVLTLFIGLVLLALLSLPVIDIEPYKAYVYNSLHLAGLAQMGTPGTYPPNQGLSGFFGRLLTRHPYGGALADAPSLARTLTLAASFALITATAVLCWPHQPLRELFCLEVGLVIIATHLIAPISWYHHMALAFVALAAAWQAAPANRPFSRVRAIIFIAYVLINLQGLLWHQLTGHTALLSLGTYGLLILWGLLAWQIVQRKWQTPRTISQ